MRKRTLFASLTLAAGTFMVVVTLAGLSSAAPPVNLQPDQYVARTYDPVVLSGSQVSAQLNPPIDQLALYRYEGGSWTPIPFQIDEVDLTGTLVVEGDGLFHPQDELVWMIWDGGEQAPSNDWPTDPFAQLNPRSEIRVTDPLSTGHESWVYLFRSVSLPRSGVSYMSWTPSAQTAAAISYTLSFDYENFFGIADLSINRGGIDILDRQKVRGAVFGIPFTEEDLADVITTPISFSAQGPVRLASGTGNQRLELYGRSYFSTLFVDTSALPFPPSEMRTSLDLNDPAISGLDTYYDSNTPGGVAIDGIPDVVPETPLVDWYQVSGGSAGPGGLVTIWGDIDPGGGSATNFYLDDINSNDPGDLSAFGDAGIQINAPGQVISFSQAIFILPPGTEGSFGARLFELYTNPLETTIQIQSLEAPVELYLPVIR